ncbi:MAG: transposase, partial [Oscillospiraceae bacterium]|jgi:predicted transposase/invertase (TIGR01784 family)|nr:transposase [Oscillospiraceae bacterium]
VVGLLKELSMDEKVQIMYEAREKARRDHEARIRFAENEGIALGEARGEARGIVKGAEQKMWEIAQKMLKRGTPVEYIIEDTGLSLADILSLQGH